MTPPIPSPIAIAGIDESTHEGRAHHWVYSAPNGYALSVITGYSSYGSVDAPYECAVLNQDGITYETSITNDVIGHCTSDDVVAVYRKVCDLS